MPKFLMLARSDARAWEGLSAEEGQRIVKQYVDWSNRMRAAKEMVKPRFSSKSLTRDTRKIRKTERSSFQPTLMER